MNLGYTSARVHAMRSRLITRQEYERLMGMSEREIINFLQNSAYKDDVDALALHDLDNLETVDRIIARNYERMIAHITRISGEEFKALLKRELEENDLWNIKLVGEAIVGGVDTKTALSLYSKPGTHDPQVYSTAKTISDLMTVVAHRFPFLISEINKDLAPYQIIEMIETQKRSKHKHERMDLASRYLIDEMNLMRIMMQKQEGISQVEVKRRLLRGGTISMQTLRRMAEAQDIELSIEILRSTRYSGAVDSSDWKTKRSLSRLEYAIHRDIVRRMRKLAGRYPVGPPVLRRYLTEREIESENLRLIIKGKRLGLDESFIREQISI